jgi:hypothetical protein
LYINYYEKPDRVVSLKDKVKSLQNRSTEKKSRSGLSRWMFKRLLLNLLQERFEIPPTGFVKKTYSFT